MPLIHFTAEGEAVSNETDEGYQAEGDEGKSSIAIAEMFSSWCFPDDFPSAFKGDEFNVYRALRNVNPSPYLFYFDYGNFKIFGSSPEAQLVVKEGKAEIHPIAGTFKRTGNDY